MRHPWTAAVGSVAVLLSGCGPGPTPISPGCTGEKAPIRTALKRAPGAVTLVDGSRLSTCVENGLDDAELQDVGIVFHQIAEELRQTARERHDAAAAVQLGYLIGATRRGAAHTGGVMSELQRRVELVGGRLQ
ncbi:MAG: hypothetical protein JWM31_10, partial [Solirubrobacterales bacterium]|nr:hypothetical protein [Solirubrobacterales bacterium]